MTTTRMFQSGNSQAIRIPSSMRSEKKDFYIQKFGDAYVIYPVDDPWRSVRETIGTFPQDFMEERSQPSWNEVAEREAL